MWRKHLNKQSRYRWKGIDANGRTLSGIDTAESKNTIIQQLKNQNIVPTRVQREFTLHHPIPKKLIVDITYQLATLIESGITLLSAIDIVRTDASNTSLQRVLSDIHDQINNGKQLHEAISSHPKLFDNFYIGLVKAGECNGQLAINLNLITQHLKLKQTFKQKIKSSLFYPLTVLCISLFITLALLIFVVPQFQSIYSDLGAQLPALTQTIISLANNLQTHWILIITALAFTALLTKHAIRNLNFIKNNLSKCRLHLPILNTFILAINFSYWSRILANTLQAGLTLPDSLVIANACVSNTTLRQHCEGAIERILRGENLSQTLKTLPYFTQRMTQMIAIGETTGQLPKMLSHLADYYSDYASNELNQLSQLFEPIVMLLLAAISAVLIIAMYLPIFNLGGIM